MDLVQLTWNPPPPKNGLCFFLHHCFIVLFQFFDIICTLKVKKKCEKWTRPETPLPHCGLSPSNFFKKTSLTVWGEYSTVQLSYLFFYFYPRPLRERESTDGHFLLLLQLFPTSNFLFLPGWKKHKFYSHPWPVTNQTWPDLIPLLCYNFCVWFIFRSDKQSDLYSGKCVAARPLSCVQSWQVAALLLQWSLIIDGAVTAQSCCKMEDSFLEIRQFYLILLFLCFFSIS